MAVLCSQEHSRTSRGLHNSPPAYGLSLSLKSGELVGLILINYDNGVLNQLTTTPIYISHESVGHLAGSNDLGWACVEESVFFCSWLGLIHVSGRQRTIGESRMASAEMVGSVPRLVLQ